MQTRLSFNILDGDNCKELAIADNSYYNSVQVTANPTLQIITPFSEFPVEVNFYKNGVTYFNSNSLGITKVSDLDYLTVLPDGLYTAKLSICPEDIYWYEKTWFRTCQLECKYDLAFLKLNVNSCEKCFDPQMIQRLERARIYIHGVRVNAKNCNNKEAKSLYKAATKILDKILSCEC